MTPYRLVSLWDMLKIHAHEYLNLGRAIEGIETTLYMAESSDGEERNLTPDEITDFASHLVTLAKQCTAIGLSVSAALVNRAAKDVPRTTRELSMVIAVVMQELKGQLFLFVPQERAKYYDYGANLVDINSKFPNAAKELTHSGNCFATAEYTASVFHSMRAVELALHALHTCLGITTPLTGTDRNWGNIARRIKDAIAAKGKSWSELDLFDELYVTLIAVKDGWRNSTMHVEATYTEDDSERIFRAVRDFMQKISSRMDGNGLPLA